jgi:hypothetical protein
MLICAIKTHVEVSKISNLYLIIQKYLTFKKYNAQIDKKKLLHFHF